MKKLVVKSMVKIFIAVAICAIISIVFTNFAPHISNDMALGQLENDDFAWSAMQTWNNFVSAARYAQVGIGVICTGMIGADIVKFIKNRKENEK